MANRFLSNVNINDEYTLPSADGTADQIITTDGAGQLSFVDQSTVVSGASRTVSILVKNISSADGGINLSKGDPVYVYGSVGASERLYVDLADAGDSSKMPCVALLDQDLSPNGEGTATVTGKLKNLITSPIDGATPTENDTIYVKSGGGLTLTKPTGSSNLIQNVGQVGRVSTSSDGNIVVSAILRSNDVPNLTTGKIWVGSSTYTTESTVVHLDETNGRMGIGTTSPSQKLEVVGTISSGAGAGASNLGMDFGGLLSPSAMPSQVRGVIGALNSGTGVAAGSIGYQPRTGVSAAHIFFTEQSEKMRITSTGNVGIGSTSPSAKLEVEQSNSSTNTVFLSNSYNNKGFRTGNSGYATFSGYQDSNNTSSGSAYGALIGLNTFYNGTNFYNDNQYIDPSSILFKDGNILFHTNDISATGNFTPNERVRISKAGNVGIGTTGPRSKLHVEGVTGSVPGIGAAASAVQIGGSTYGTLFSTLTSGTGVIQQGRSDGVALTFPLLINPNGGNVGIGTTSPSQKLDVAGDATFDGRIYTNATALASVGILGKAIANGWAARYDSNDANYSGFYFDINNHNVIVGRVAGGTITNYIAASGSSYLNGGNVGIGITNPGYKLDVNGDLRVDNGNLGGTSGDEVTHAKIHGQRHFLEFKEVRTANGTDWKDTTYKLQAGVDATNHQSIDFVADSSYQEHIDIRTGNQQFNTRFTYDGKVGIGTTSPSSKLQVNGDLTVGDDSTVGSFINVIAAGTSQDAGIRFGSESNTDSKAAIYTNTSNSDLHFDVTESTRMLIDSATGNVGIGTTSPAQKLHVIGNSEITGDIFLGRYLFHNDDTNTWLGFPLADTISFRTNGSDRMYINSSGNVGIGTTSPGAKLDIINTGGNATSLSLAQTYSGLTVKPYSAVDSKLTFSANSGNTQIIQATNNASTTGRQIALQPFEGNVGIGTTSPTSKLHVAQQLTSPTAPMVRFVATRTGSTYGAVNVRVDNVDYGTGMRFNRSGTYDSGAVSFYNGASPVGSININTSSTSYNTTSDYRLKENVTSITDGITRVKQLQPKRFNFIGDTSVVDGFIAHEAKQVVPEAVTGEKDEVLPNGEPVYQGIDQAKLVPLLTAALQDAITKIEELETRIQTLENK